MTSVIDIPALFSIIAEKVNSKLSKRLVDPFEVYYDYGRYIEVTRNLVQKAGGVTTDSRRFPLIWLVVPYSVTETMDGNEAKVRDIEIVIATRTEQDSNTTARIEKTFRPRLWPIYDELRSQIVKSGYFQDVDINNFHTRIDQPYWDGKETNGRNLFSDYIDAIQLKNISLTLNETTCDRFRLIGATA